MEDGSLHTFCLEDFEIVARSKRLVASLARKDDDFYAVVVLVFYEQLVDAFHNGIVQDDHFVLWKKLYYSDAVLFQMGELYE